MIQVDFDGNHEKTEYTGEQNGKKPQISAKEIFSLFIQMGFYP